MMVRSSPAGGEAPHDRAVVVIAASFPLGARDCLSDSSIGEGVARRETCGLGKATRNCEVPADCIRSHQLEPGRSESAADQLAGPYLVHVHVEPARALAFVSSTPPVSQRRGSAGE